MHKDIKDFNNNQKGALDFADPLLLGFMGLILYIAISVFTPFVSLLSTATENMTNAGLFMTLVYLIPVLMVAMVIIGFIKKVQEPRY
jgi:hypothetical protein